MKICFKRFSTCREIKMYVKRFIYKLNITAERSNLTIFTRPFRLYIELENKLDSNLSSLSI